MVWGLGSKHSLTKIGYIVLLFWGLPSRIPNIEPQRGTAMEPMGKHSLTISCGVAEESCLNASPRLIAAFGLLGT